MCLEFFWACEKFGMRSVTFNLGYLRIKFSPSLQNLPFMRRKSTIFPLFSFHYLADALFPKKCFWILCSDSAIFHISVPRNRQTLNLQQSTATSWVQTALQRNSFDSFFLRFADGHEWTLLQPARAPWCGRNRFRRHSFRWPPFRRPFHFKDPFIHANFFDDNSRSASKIVTRFLLAVVHTKAGMYTDAKTTSTLIQGSQEPGQVAKDGSSRGAAPGLAERIP